MKASKARTLTAAAFVSEKNTYLKTLYTYIEKTAKQGVDGVNVKSPSENILTYVVDQLENDGYTVIRSSGIDIGGPWDNLIIEWSSATTDDKWDHDAMGG